ncbi:MAG TPA: acid phosphatase, partial [Chloroflexota bacterium]
ASASASASASAAPAAPSSAPASASPKAQPAVTLVAGKTPINHVVVIYMENRSFDSLYGLFPGAEGINEAKYAPQVDKDGKPYATLPQVMNTNFKPAIPESRVPEDLPNKPFDISQFVQSDWNLGDLVHRFYQEQMQIDGGKMDKFALISDAQGEVMGYYDATKLPLGAVAKQYVLADHFFHAAFGGSFLNHFWLVCACSPRFDNAPADMVAKPLPDGTSLPQDENGKPTNDGSVTPDGFGINTMYTSYKPHPASAKPEVLVPPQTMPHIGDRLDEKKISWAWYSGGWDDAMAGKPDDLFQFHHQAFAFFKDLADGTDAKALHLRDEKDFMEAVKSPTTLPQVVFIKPLGPDNEHPGYATTIRGEQHAVSLIKAIQDSPNWKDTAIIVTYDEHGGFWDHVAPPKGDRWGPGSRVPAIIASPYAKKGFVDKTVYDTTSILKFIEVNWGLQPLGDRDAKVNSLDNAFDFSQKP